MSITAIDKEIYLLSSSKFHPRRGDRCYLNSLPRVKLSTGKKFQIDIFRYPDCQGQNFCFSSSNHNIPSPDSGSRRNKLRAQFLSTQTITNKNLLSTEGQGEIARVTEKQAELDREERIVESEVISR